MSDNNRYRVRRGFRGVAVLQRLVNGPAFMGGYVDASIRVQRWVDVPYNAAPAELRAAEASHQSAGQEPREETR